MSVYDCKRGDVVITGDSYSCSPCVCIKEKYWEENYGFDVVIFLDLTTGSTHKSGGKDNFRLDFCQKVDKITEVEVVRVLKVWGVKDESVIS